MGGGRHYNRVMVGAMVGAMEGVVVVVVGVVVRGVEAILARQNSVSAILR